MARHPEVPNFIIAFFPKLTQDLAKSNRGAQAEQLKNTQLFHRLAEDEWRENRLRAERAWFLA